MNVCWLYFARSIFKFIIFNLWTRTVRSPLQALLRRTLYCADIARVLTSRSSSASKWPQRKKHDGGHENPPFPHPITKRWVEIISQSTCKIDGCTMYVCKCLCIYVCTVRMYVIMYVLCMYVCNYACIRVYMYVPTYVCNYVCMYILCIYVW
jgi:hypothetical protein